MSFFYKVARSALFKADPEKAHNMTLSAMKAGAYPHAMSTVHDMLIQEILGLRFPNPVGLSAGFDKNAEVIEPVLNMGFGFTEVGTVTPQPQDGNPKPRIFRDIPNEAVINRMGFPNGGMEAFEKNFEAFEKKRASLAGIVGINIGMNKTQTEPALDYSILIQRFATKADYFTINISSPNTPGLRNLQSRAPLLELLDAAKSARASAAPDAPPPILVKLAPDLDDEQIAELSGTVIDAGIDGVIVGNTTLDRPNYLSDDFRDESGGLSGKPLTAKATLIIEKFYTHLKDTMPIIGVGGISNADDAYAKIKAGASLVQLYTGMIYQGPSIARDINKGLVELLEADGYAHISNAVGAAHG